MASQTARRGPRAGGVDTKAQIIAAAGAVFVRDGYERGSVRAVAREAGVDPALVRHYFVSKQELFVEAMRPQIDLNVHVETLAEGDPGRVGERVMTFFVRVWSDAEQGPRVIALMRAALEHPEVAEFVRQVIIEGVIEKVARRVGAANPVQAAATAASQVFGLAMIRHVAALEPLASEPVDSLVTRYGPIITRLLREGADKR